MSTIIEELEGRYNNLFAEYDLEKPLHSENIGLVIKQTLHEFLQKAKNPAIYCKGGHTQMLMADFMNELKKVHYIIDNYAKAEREEGFCLISDEKIESCEIDAIILSSYKFRKDIKQRLAKNHPTIPVLDFYDEFEKRGITVQSDYYYANHPYQYYKRINQLQREIQKDQKAQIKKKLYLDLVTEYLYIKDFRTALTKLYDWKNTENIISEDRDMVQRLVADIEALYELQKRAAASLPKDHVLMLCLDGLRRQDLSCQTMPRLKEMLNESGYQYTNAYSFSTSTFESLMPVYSENSDLRCKYYEKNYVNLEECRFASLAREQNKEIYIYGDGNHYIESPLIQYRDQFLTVTEKLWQFILDAHQTKSALFYVHELYESHFTFSNHYTESHLMSEGTAKLFDFLPVKVEQHRTDYKRQHDDAIQYLDDVMEPLLRPMPCAMVLYADHGNLIVDYNTTLSEIGETEYTCSEGWTQIPLALRAPQMGVGIDNKLISLMQLNEIVVSLLTQKSYQMPDIRYIKMARSELYNPDFRFLYEMIGKKESLQAFECFLFTEGKKFILFADGTTKVYDTQDRPITDVDIKTLVEQVQKEITVCDISDIQV